MDLQYLLQGYNEIQYKMYYNFLSFLSLLQLSLQAALQRSIIVFHHTQ